MNTKSNTIKKLSTLERLFSLKNVYNAGKKHKQLCILGIKISWKCEKTLKKLFSHKVKNNSILLIEANVSSHGECLPSFINALNTLGYSVDVIVTPKIHEENPFCILPTNLIDNYYVLELECIKTFVESDKIQEYKYCILNSNFLYYGPTIETAPSFFDFFENYKSPKNGYIVLEHHLDRIIETLAKEKRVLRLTDFNDNDDNIPFFNTNYYGEKINKKSRNKTINFISAGGLRSFRRNGTILVNAVKELVNSGVENFKVTVIGSGSLENIDEKIASKFDIKGRVSYKELFENMQKADFFLPLLDPENKLHNRYIKNGTSGSFNLIYGFVTPCIIAEKFAKHHYFDNKNALIYQQNSELSSYMLKAINISDDDYFSMCESLEKTVKNINNKSLKNLKNVLTHRRYKIVSLGYDCLPRTVATKEGLKKTKKQGEPSMPFDLAVTPAESVLKCLNNDFKDYLKSIVYSKKCKYYINKKYNILYNHDRDCSKNNTGRKKIIERFRNRINNFRTILKSDDFIFFLLNNPTDERICNDINTILKDKRGDLPFKLIVLDIDTKLNMEYLDNSISVFNEKHPFNKPSDWWLSENKKAFSDYSKIISNFLANEIEAQAFKTIRYNYYEKNVDINTVQDFWVF